MAAGVPGDLSAGIADVFFKLPLIKHNYAWAGSVSAGTPLLQRPLRVHPASCSQAAVPGSSWTAEQRVDHAQAPASERSCLQAQVSPCRLLPAASCRQSSQASERAEGGCGAAKGVLLRLLKKQTVALMPEGIAGIFLGASVDREAIFISKRKGFVKLAIEAGVGAPRLASAACARFTPVLWHLRRRSAARCCLTWRMHRGSGRVGWVLNGWARRRHCAHLHPGRFAAAHVQGACVAVAQAADLDRRLLGLGLHARAAAAPADHPRGKAHPRCGWAATRFCPPPLAAARGCFWQHSHAPTLCLHSCWMSRLSRNWAHPLTCSAVRAVEQCSQPSQQQVDKVHAEVVATLEALYYRHRHLMPGFEDRPLHIN